MLFQILQDAFTGRSTKLDDFFIIDQTLGKDVKFTLDDIPGGSGGQITEIEILYPNGTQIFDTKDTAHSTVSTTFDHLEVRLIFAKDILLE